MKCRICNNEKNNKQYSVEEKMYGLGDTFEYNLCSNCNCLFIANYPLDIKKYYPNDYYSYGTIDIIKENILNKLLRKFRTYYSINTNKINAMIGKILGKPYYSFLFQAIEVKTNSKILDIGCGNGELLNSLYKDGFKNLFGIDPFIQEDIIYNENFKILKKNLFELSEKFDIVMLNHSLEHMPEQQKVFSQLKKLLNPNGSLIIRIPVVESFAWEKYKENWVQLDAPRHFYLHSYKSIDLLVKEAGLEIYKITNDSTEFQFIGSEQYLNNIPLNSNKSYYKNNKEVFSTEQIIKYKEKAKELNKNLQGDQACFYIKVNTI